MQDLNIEDESPKVETIEKLIIDAPGESTVGKNTDLFIKRDRLKHMCLSCCGQALLTMQINAPSGGQGHRVGLRGGGPVNTIIMVDSLWQTLWSNVLTENEFAVLAAVGKSQAADKFPWCAQTRTSENDRSTTPQDVHPAQIYWSMPRRMRLKLSDEHGECDLCKESGRVVKEYHTKPYGIKYDGFVYPLTPTYQNKDGMVLSVHQHESLGYKHWLGYVQNTDKGAERARVIAAAFSKRLNNFRLWAFGYDMNKMMASCWYEGVMPVVFIENEEQWRCYNKEIEKLIQSADVVSDYVSKAVVKALNKSIFNAVRQRFWQETESEFYRQISFLRDEILQDKDESHIRQTWHKYLVEETLSIFDDMSQAEMIEDVNAERVAKAHNELKKSLYDKKIKVAILGLPEN
jgi:CRISPR system Cascade subunit CasA